MHEVLYRLIRAHYTEVLATLPMVLLLTGLLIAVGIDPYIQKRQKRIMLIIALVVYLAAALYLVRPAKRKEIIALWDRKWNRTGV